MSQTTDRTNTAERLWVWDIIRASWDGPRLGEALSKGYEPFAVTSAASASESIWLRKKVTP